MLKYFLGRAFTVVPTALLLFFAAAGQDLGWYEKLRQIKPLVSTYDDVIRVMGEPVAPRTSGRYAGHLAPGRHPVEYYYFGENQVEISFSQVTCSDTMPYDKSAWDVPKWTVIRVEYYPLGSLKVEDLPFSISGFQKSRFLGIFGVSYSDNAAGIGVSLSPLDNRVFRVAFGPSSSSKSLRCSNKNQRTGDRRTGDSKRLSVPFVRVASTDAGVHFI